MTADRWGGSWAGNPDPMEVPGNQQGAWAMPVESTEPTGDKHPRRARPGCADCGDEPCPRHAYDPFASLGITRQNREDKLEGTWYPV